MSEAPNSQPARSPVIPDKLYFRIGEVARLLEVETHTLRFWETEFPQLKVGKGGTGQRLYRRRDVELVFEIKHLLYSQGYTIPGARQFLQNRQRRKPPSASELAASQHEPATVPAQDGEIETAPQRPLERIRAELRDLSALLDPSSSSEDRASANPTGRERTQSGPQTPRRGLHLAARSAPKQPPARSSADQTTPHASPGLFDRQSE